MKIKQSLVAAVSLLAGTVIQTSAQNVVTNGDFSSNAASFTVYPGYSGQVGVPTNPAITGWTGAGLFGINGTGTGSGVQNIFGPASLDNLTADPTTRTKDFAFLQNGSGGTTSLTQSLTLTQGQQYTLSFEAAARNGDYAIPTATVTIAGTTYSLSSANLSKQNFQLYSFSFAAAAVNTLSVVNTSTTPGGDSTLDVSDFSLVAVPVPEPATWLAGALLLGGAAWTLRRRAPACAV